MNPKEAAKVFVLYNEGKNNAATDEEAIQKMVIEKIIVPNARAYTRLKGSSHSGKEFITGDTRATFQEDFQREMQDTCAAQGIEVIQALITTSSRRRRSPSRCGSGRSPCSRKSNITKEILQQAAEQDLAVQKATVLQKQAEVAAEQEVVVVTVNAKKKQEVAIIDANKRLGVAEKKFEAAKDLAAAIMAKGKADADVIRFQNEAQAAGWQKSIEAFGGDGAEFARYTLLKKIAPAYKAMMVNTDNSALMDVFKAFKTNKTPAKRGQDGVSGKNGKRRSGNRTSENFQGTQIMKRYAPPIIFLALVALIGYEVFDWTVNRVYVPEGKSLQLRYKGPLIFTWLAKKAEIGKFADESKGEMGVLEQLRGPGRHFYCPIWWERNLVDDVVVHTGEIAFLNSMLGEEGAEPQGRPVPRRRRHRPDAGKRHPPPHPRAGPLSHQSLWLPGHHRQDRSPSRARASSSIPAGCRFRPAMSACRPI